MISVCVPIYNVSVSDLTKELDRQLSMCGYPYEILLMDDASTIVFREMNMKLVSGHIKYIQLPENIGRSRIRNKLATNATYRYLIFMDCDSKIPSDNYIKDYLACCHPYVVCYGGRIYEVQCPDKRFLLRWKYGVERESLPADKRKINSNYSFCTNNFLVDKQVFDLLRFNEDLDGYGHEDTFFGLELMAHRIPVKHIDNPLVHIGLEDAEDFLFKTGNSVLNLFKIDKILKEKYPAYVNHARLIRTCNKIKRIGVHNILSVLFRCFRPLMKRNLLGNKPSLTIFDMYKLGILLNIKCP